jgi:ATP-dependent protease ClpP protease subunit
MVIAMISDQISDSAIHAKCLKASCSAAHEMIEQCHKGKYQGVTYIEKDNILCITGNITWGGDFWSEGNEIKSIKSFKIEKNVHVVVSSYGGELTNGIMISRYLRKFDYSVIVSDFCLSSCAQFIFIGSKKRLISEGGVVAFHGGPFPPDQIAKLNITETEKNKVTKAMAEFVHFYKEMKIPIEITYKFPQSILDEAKASKSIVMWSPKESDYKAYGVDVDFCDSHSK